MLEYASRSRAALAPFFNSRAKWPYNLWSKLQRESHRTPIRIGATSGACTHVCSKCLYAARNASSTLLVPLGNKYTMPASVPPGVLSAALLATPLGAQLAPQNANTKISKAIAISPFMVRLQAVVCTAPAELRERRGDNGIPMQKKAGHQQTTTAKVQKQCPKQCK